MHSGNKKVKKGGMQKLLGRVLWGQGNLRSVQITICVWH